jgi:hypothetical protein
MKNYQLDIELITKTKEVIDLIKFRLDLLVYIIVSGNLLFDNINNQHKVLIAKFNLELKQKLN